MGDLNTETISISAVALVVSDDTSRLGKYLHSFGALLLVCVQFFALLLVVHESTFPKCTSMTDCPSAAFCANTWWITHPELLVVKVHVFTMFPFVCPAVLQPLLTRLLVFCIILEQDAGVIIVIFLVLRIVCLLIVIGIEACKRRCCTRSQE